MESSIEQYAPGNLRPDEWDLEGAITDLEGLFLVPFDMPHIPEEENAGIDQVIESFTNEALKAFDVRRSTIPDDIKEDFFRMIMLQSIDDKWMDHLYELDYLREGIYLRSYAQKDPLVEYKQEAFQMFSEMLEEIDRSILWALFRARFSIGDREEKRGPRSEVTVHQVASAYGGGPKAASPDEVKKQQVTHAKSSQKPKIAQAHEKVGRNDPCPCGSGKKYKKCCGKQAI